MGRDINQEIKSQTGIYLFNPFAVAPAVKHVYAKYTDVIVPMSLPDFQAYTVWDSANHKVVARGGAVGIRVAGFGHLLPMDAPTITPELPSGAHGVFAVEGGSITYRGINGEIEVLGQYPQYQINVGGVERSGEKMERYNSYREEWRERGEVWEGYIKNKDGGVFKSDVFLIEKKAREEYNDALYLINSISGKKKVIDTIYGSVIIAYKEITEPEVIGVKFFNSWISDIQFLYVLPPFVGAYYTFNSDCEDGKKRQTIEYKVKNSAVMNQKGGVYISDLVQLYVTTKGETQVNKIQTCDYHQTSSEPSFFFYNTVLDTTNSEDMQRIQGYAIYKNTLGFYDCNILRSDSDLRQIFSQVEIMEDMSGYMSVRRGLSISKYNCRVDYTIEHEDGVELQDIYIGQKNKIEEYVLQISHNCNTDKILSVPVCILGGMEGIQYAGEIGDSEDVVIPSGLECTYTQLKSFIGISGQDLFIGEGEL